MNETNARLDEQVAIMYFQELSATYREISSIYFKSTTLALGIYTVSLGYLLKIPLSPLLSRVASLLVLVILVMWYLGCFYLLNHHDHHSEQLQKTAAFLQIDFKSKVSMPLKSIILICMGGGIPLAAVIIALIVHPPTTAIL